MVHVECAFLDVVSPLVCGSPELFYFILVSSHYYFLNTI